MTGKLLIVDDDSLVLEALRQMFLKEFEVIVASSGHEAMELFRQHGDFDAVILDIRMAKMDGLQTAEAIAKHNAEVPIIFNTGFPGDHSQAQIDRDHHPFDYVGKNEPPDRLRRTVRNAVRQHQLMSTPDNLVDIARFEYGMVGRSELMREVYQQIERLAPTDNTIMVLGPSGVGKELVVRAIHLRSQRADKPMRVYACNVTTPELAQSALFGHCKGAFTSADSDKIGVFETVDKGTLILDEVGKLDLDTQSKLLRVLDSGEMARLGEESSPFKVDVRIVCSTNAHLQKMVEDGAFREDLYYRLYSNRIIIPPLREHRTDIPELIEYFVEKYCDREKIPPRLFAPDALALMMEYTWPGNIRHLLKTVNGLCGACASSLITRSNVEAFLDFSGNGQSPNSSLREKTDDYQRLIIEQILVQFSGNVSAAARELRTDPANLRKTIKRLGIRPGDFDSR